MAAARREIRAVATGREDADDVVLVASELCANAFLHGRPPIVLRAVLDGPLMRIEVENRRRSATPSLATTPAMPAADAIGGRGLALVQELADDWGAQDSDESTCVWAELRT